MNRIPSRGMTAIELAISMALISACLLIGGSAITRSFSATSDLNRGGDLERRTQSAIDSIVAALADAGRTTVSACAPPVGASGLTFQCPSGFASDAVTWRSAQRIEWVVSPTDSTMGSVVWRRDVGLGTETTVILATNVPALAPGETTNSIDDNADGLQDEKGLSFSRTGNSIRVRLSVKRKNAAGVFKTLTGERTVALRN